MAMERIALPSTVDGICRCGCGQTTNALTRSNARLDQKRGEFWQYRIGHHRRKFDGALPDWTEDPATGCWIWNRPLNTNGYGSLVIKNRRVPAHRWVYESQRGPIPDELVLDHLCRNRACVNPDHLEPVTDKANILRGVHPVADHAVQTHCIHGHEFTPENTGYLTDKKGRLHRRCRACHREDERRRKRDRVGSYARR